MKKVLQYQAHPRLRSHPLRTSVTRSSVIGFGVSQGLLEEQNSIRANISNEGDVLYWLAQLELGSPVVTVFMVERPRTWWLLSPQGWMPSSCSLALQAWMAPTDPLVEDGRSCVMTAVKSGRSSSRADGLSSKE